MTLLMLFTVIVFSACNSVGTVRKDESSVNLETKTATSVRTEEQLIEQPTEQVEHKELLLYYSNSNADGLEMETIEVEAVTPDIIINNLTKHNIVSIDTKVNDFVEMEEEGRRIINLDLNKAFEEYLKTMGTSGELVIMAALTNTFLEAYHADALCITAEGKPVESGHAVYKEQLIYRNPDFNADAGLEE